MALYNCALFMLVGFTGSFISGLAGIGGAIIMIPLLLYLPPLWGFTALNIQSVSGITMFQVLIASGVGMLGHRKLENVHTELVKIMGSAIVIGSLLGAISSQFISSSVLENIFALLALAAAILMLIPRKETNSTDIKFNKFLAFLIAFLTGILAGLIGAGGAFILIPLMLYILKIPLRTTIGSSLAVVFFSALAGTLGKIGVGQVPFLITSAVILGAIPGAKIGSQLSASIPTKILHYLLAGLISLSALKIWGGLL